MKYRRKMKKKLNFTNHDMKAGNIASIRNIYNKWIVEREGIFSPSKLDFILKAFSTPRKTSLRINNLKVTKDSKQKLLSSIQNQLIKLKHKNTPKLIPCSFYSEGYYINESSVLVRHLAHMYFIT
jgi:16S rRNA C967 or C1407 C5-methylase (RsmB/RsmF family)